MTKTFRLLYLTLILFRFPASGQAVQSISDWVNYNKYAEANKRLPGLAPGDQRVVFMGNSITEGWIALDSAFFAGHGYIDRGISGQTSSQMLLRFRQDVIDLKSTVVIILAGTNDIAQNAGLIALEDILGNIVSMVQLAEVNHIKVIVSSVLPAYEFPWRKGLEPAEKIAKLNAMIKSYCDENHLPYVDYYSKMVDKRKGLDKRYTKDGVHPTIDGYKVMEPLVQEQISKALQ